MWKRPVGIKTKKTDNGALAAKLALRRHFLTAYHLDVLPTVLDCCQGEGVLWTALKKEYALANYCGLDTKPKKGRLAIDSYRFLAAGGWKADVVDVDTYGSPWKHWIEILRATHPALTVFLTVGHVSMSASGFTQVDTIPLVAAGLSFETLTVPPSLQGKVSDLCVPYALARATAFGWTIVACLEAESPVAGRGGNSCRYFGIRLERPHGQVAA